jgi:hypothetical protein
MRNGAIRDILADYCRSLVDLGGEPEIARRRFKAQIGVIVHHIFYFNHAMRAAAAL